MNINDNCVSLSRGWCGGLLLEKRADIGIAYDGDANGAIFSDEKGKRGKWRPDNGFMCAIENKKAGMLKKIRHCETTVMSNMGPDIAMKKAGDKSNKDQGWKTDMSLEEMVKDCNLGGEQSGHIIFLDYNTTGDGITTLQVLSLMNKTGKRLSEHASCMAVLPQVLLNVRVRERKDIATS